MVLKTNSARLVRLNTHARRKLNTGSSTAPVVFESGRSSITAIGSAGVWPRPRKRPRSVSYCTAPTVSPSTTTT